MHTTQNRDVQKFANKVRYARTFFRVTKSRNGGEAAATLIMTRTGPTYTYARTHTHVFFLLESLYARTHAIIIANADVDALFAGPWPVSSLSGERFEFPVRGVQRPARPRQLLEGGLYSSSVREKLTNAVLPTAKLLSVKIDIRLIGIQIPIIPTYVEARGRWNQCQMTYPYSALVECFPSWFPPSKRKGWTSETSVSTGPPIFLHM